MPANPTHHTDVVDEPCQAYMPLPRTLVTGLASAASSAGPSHDAAGNDPDGDGYPDAKADSKFPHHEVDETSGEPGDANMAGCQAAMGRIDQANIPAGDDVAVRAHLQAHMDDMATMPGEPDAPGATLVAPRSYAHVTKALTERAWAVQPQVLSYMVELVRFRSDGGLLSADEIEQRLAAAKAQNGERIGGAQAGSVAVIPMYGLITQRATMMSDFSGGTSIDELRSLLRTALADPTVTAVVFDVDSPGGSVDGVPEFAAELRSARAGSKPVIAQVNTLAASAAYWLASSCSEIVCTPSGEVGSIGVFAAHEDLSKAAEMEGVKTTLVSAGPYKTEGNPFEPLTDEARAAIQDQVDAFYGMFVGDVARGRGVGADVVTSSYGQGRTLLASKARSAGMVDRIDTLEATIRRLQPPKAARPGAASLQIAASAARAATAASVGRADAAWNRRMRGKRK
jgi:signal peptide peptidase SppA